MGATSTLSSIRSSYSPWSQGRLGRFGKNLENSFPHVSGQSKMLLPHQIDFSCKILTSNPDFSWNKFEPLIVKK
jgi:hypothetical protein